MRHRLPREAVRHSPDGGSGRSQRRGRGPRLHLALDSESRESLLSRLLLLRGLLPGPSSLGLSCPSLGVSPCPSLGLSWAFLALPWAFLLRPFSGPDSSSVLSLPFPGRFSLPFPGPFLPFPGPLSLPFFEEAATAPQAAFPLLRLPFPPPAVPRYWRRAQITSASNHAS